MSDPVAAPAPAAPAQAVPAPVKASMLNSLNIAYNEFIGKVRMLPIHPGIMQNAFNHLDTGLIWLEKAISMIEFAPLPAAVEADAAVAGAVVQDVQAVVDAIEPKAPEAVSEPVPAA